MNASKENAAKARSNLGTFLYTDVGVEEKREAVQFVQEFLQAAEKKLPTEAAYQRQALRANRPKRLLKSERGVPYRENQ